MEKNMDTNFDFNKTGKFDFGKVGKRMPYSTPEGFFKEMEANILEQVKNDKPAPVRIQPKKRTLRKVIWTAAIGLWLHRWQYFWYSTSISQPLLPSLHR